MNNNIDFRLIKQYGLSLNDKTKYHISYCCHTWRIRGIYEELDKAIECMGGTPEEYDRECNETYKRDFIGNNCHYSKGLMQNLNVWELLEQLSDCILEDIEHIKTNGSDPDENDKEETRMSECWFIDTRMRRNREDAPKASITFGH